MSTKTTPAKSPHSSRARAFPGGSSASENSDPNVEVATLPCFAFSPSPAKRSAKSPAIKSAKKSMAISTAPQARAPVPPRERRFIVAKKKGGSKKRLEEAYEALRASQEGFFQNQGVEGSGSRTGPFEHPATSSGTGGSWNGCRKLEDVEEADEELLKERSNSKSNIFQYPPAGETGKIGYERLRDEENELIDLEGSSRVRRMRSLVMEKAMRSIPEQGSGRVKHLVNAFETLLSISGEKDSGSTDANMDTKVETWALPGLGARLSRGTTSETDSVSVFSSSEFSTSLDIVRNARICSSVDGNGERFSWGTNRISAEGGHRSRRSSSDSMKSWNRRLKATNQHPFKLRTEQRGRLKEEQFLKKVKEMILEDERRRIPIAQGLPWTTDEPESLMKPPVKESTEPLDLVLHSDARAMERAEFDNYITERMKFAEQLRLERERQQKLEEEEEIRRLRKELVPKAQPMPYFDRPFIPQKSSRPRTVPQEPRFHVRPPTKTSYCYRLQRRDRNAGKMNVKCHGP